MAEIAEAALSVAKSKGLDLEVVEFSDRTSINPATDAGDLQAGAFQHAPYLAQQNSNSGLHIVAVGGDTVLLPMAGYSRRFAKLEEIPQGAQVSIPNDPTNLGRALKTLEAAGVLKLKALPASEVTELDITENPKDLVVVPMETAQLPRSLESERQSTHRP